MNRLFKFLGILDREYRSSDFSVKVDPVGHEAVNVIYTRNSVSRNFSGERVGRKTEQIHVVLPQQIEPNEAQAIAHDLEIAFLKMGYRHYVVARKISTNALPHTQWETLVNSKPTNPPRET